MAGNRGQTAGVRERDHQPVGSGLEIARANLHGAYSLVAALARSGVAHFVISSGARSAPLVLAIAELDSVRTWPLPDERAAGFWALGIGKATGQPAALICTSGTAGANYFPAVIEAHYSHTPLIVLTADRPPRLRGRGAPQTIDQVELYSQYPRYFSDLPVPSPELAVSSAWIEDACRAVTIALGPDPGPVHLNVPFEEPLVPEPEEMDGIVRSARDSLPAISTRARQAVNVQQTTEAVWDRVANALEKASCLLIVCGPQYDNVEYRSEVVSLANVLRAPALADPASQIRFDSAPDSVIVAHYDLILRDREFASLNRPDCVLRLGSLPTSKAVNEWLAAVQPHDFIAIDHFTAPADPYERVTDSIVCDLASGCAEIRRRLADQPGGDTTYRDRWTAADACVRELLDVESGAAEIEPGFEGHYAAAVCEGAPTDSTIFLANSLPIRMADMFAQAGGNHVRILVNRGANGIDGLISTAAGAAVAHGDPVVLLIGDVAFQHDLGGLLGVARNRPNLKIVLINNGGGGIFEFLPIARHPEHFERLVAMPQNLDISKAAAAFGIPYSHANTLSDFRDVFASCFTNSDPCVIEVTADRKYTRRKTQEIIDSVRQRLSGLRS